MKVQIFSDAGSLGIAAGMQASHTIRNAISKQGAANIILATGTSQFETLKCLTADSTIDWSRVTIFHLDEYIGLPKDSPAGFGNYILERFISKIPPVRNAFLIDGSADPLEECERVGNLLLANPVDLALVGIGENGHLAFNDPPADFETNAPYIIVDLDEKCRMQQLGEGWFKDVSEVPRKAISMSIRQILKSKKIICSVPDLRKAEAVRNCLRNPVSNLFPASILQSHEDCDLYLDAQSSSLISE